MKGENMEHKYSKKFKDNVNLPYAKVGRRVFRSLFDAETYCTEHDLNVDQAIEYGDSEELKSEVQKIALYQKAILSGALDALEKHKEQLNKELQFAVNDRDRAEENRDLLIGYYKERVAECVAKLQGVYDALKIVHDMRNNLEWLTGWKD